MRIGQPKTYDTQPAEGRKLTDESRLLEVSEDPQECTNSYRLAQCFEQLDYYSEPGRWAVCPIINSRVIIGHISI
ncbi:hypothetical protein ACOME3_007091 [Neoechinorhynchus agilis]